MKNQRAIWVATLLCSAAMAPFNSRAFDAGSDGSYGALNITTVGTNLVTMPADGVFRCTTINVATNCTLIFAPNALNTPVYLLAQSNIVINGIIAVSGADGQASGATSVAGPGGFGGGSFGTASTVAAGAGQGPGGSISNLPANFFQNGASFGTLGYGGSTGASTNYGNLLLVPLIGGSGGSGLQGINSYAGASGGAGGGAILLASSTNVTVNGSILARGGNGFYNGFVTSGGGSGGAVRIVSPTVSVLGTINVSGGTNSTIANCYGGNGRVRIDTTTSVSANVIGNGKGTPFAPIVSYGRSLFTGLPSPASPQLYFVTVAGTNILAGTNNYVTLGAGNSTNQVVTLCGTNFLGTVPVQIVATPVNGTPFTTNIVLSFPSPNILVSTNVTINIPLGIATQLNAYANYGVQP